MPAQRRLEPAAVTGRLRRLWRRRRGDWLDGAGETDSRDWPLAVLLHPPTEREAARSVHAVRGWSESWRCWRGGGELVWVERAWADLGRQRLPERLLLHAPGAVADWLGEGERWRRALERRDRLLGRFPALAGRLGAHFDWLADAEEPELVRLAGVLAELSTGSGVGLYLRQLPIAGIDSKWVAANRARVTELLRPLLAGDRGEDVSGDLWSLAGLRREPALLRLRLLDPGLRARVGGLGDISAPADQIAALPLAPERVFIVENVQTGLAFTDLPAAVVIFGLGYAVDRLEAIPWLRGADCRYWGDLDTHGLAILERLRGHLPGVRSLLMDEATLLDHPTLWSREGKPVRNLQPARLDVAERTLYQGLANDRWGPAVRLEQERIAWDYAWERMVAVSSRTREGAGP
jgi:hypothetical protein